MESNAFFKKCWKLWMNNSFGKKCPCCACSGDGALLLSVTMAWVGLSAVQCALGVHCWRRAAEMAHCVNPGHPSLSPVTGRLRCRAIVRWCSSTLFHLVVSSLLWNHRHNLISPSKPRETLPRSDGLLGNGREERECLSFTPETLGFEFYISHLGTW